jgi:hypothetical protein
MHSTESTAWGHENRSSPPASGLRAQLARGLHLTWTSLHVLAKDPQLLVLPFLALVLNGFIWLLVFFSVWALGAPPWSPNSSFLYQEMYAAYLISYFLAVYFMTAITASAYLRIQGRRPSVSEGIAAANRCLIRIIAWCLFAGTVGVWLRILALRWEQAGRITAKLFGNSWPIASLFVLPVMVIEDLRPIQAFHRSRTLIRERWGSHPSGVLGTGVVFSLLFLLGFVPLLWGVLGNGGYLFAAITAFYWLILVSLWSVVHGILVTSLYHYATQSSAAFGFAWQALNRPWVR